MGCLNSTENSNTEMSLPKPHSKTSFKSKSGSMESKHPFKSKHRCSRSNSNVSKPNSEYYCGSEVNYSQDGRSGRNSVVDS